MLPTVILYTTLGLMALVAVSCTALCLAWSIPSWRRRLAARPAVTESPASDSKGLVGWRAQLGSGLVSVGIGAVALIAWYGCYCILETL